MIFWTLITILCGDPGIVNKKMITQIYQDNGIVESKIGQSITMKDVLEILTLNSFVRNGLISAEEVQECNHRLGQADSIKPFRLYTPQSSRHSSISTGEGIELNTL